MNYFKWIPGRQCANQEIYYEKLKIFSIYKMDCYLIRYSKGLAIGYHVDEVPGHAHYRLNIQLKGKNRLTIMDFASRKCHFINRRFTWFRADKLHSFGVTLEDGLILSFGFAVKNHSISR